QARRFEHDARHAAVVFDLERRHPPRQRDRAQRDLRVIALALAADGLVAEGRALGAAGDDADVFHGWRAPNLPSSSVRHSTKMRSPTSTSSRPITSGGAKRIVDRPHESRRRPFWNASCSSAPAYSLAGSPDGVRSSAPIIRPTPRRSARTGCWAWIARSLSSM